MDIIEGLHVILLSGCNFHGQKPNMLEDSVEEESGSRPAAPICKGVSAARQAQGEGEGVPKQRGGMCVFGS